MVIKRLVFVLSLAFALCTASLPVLAAPEPQSGPQTWTVLVGAEADMQQLPEGMAGAWQIMHFYPGTITIDEGDTIVWKLNSMEFHTVSFLTAGQTPPDLFVPEGGGSQRLLANPAVFLPQGGTTFDGSSFTGSGQLSRDAASHAPQEYKLTFTKAGSYDYLCLIHPGMNGKVIVQPAGTAYPKTQAQIDADAKTMIDADMQAATAASAQAQQVPPVKPGPNGTTIHVVKMGYSAGTLDYMQFVPANLTINAGDSVEWDANNEGTPHTATFLSGAQEPEMIQPEPQQNGPPKLVVNPQDLVPAGGQTYSGTGYFNSGFIFGAKDPTPGPRTYTLTFDKVGTYEYLCLLHDTMGMVGKITVVASGAATNAPTTLPTTGGVASEWLLVALGGALAAAGTLAWGRRRKVTA